MNWDDARIFVALHRERTLRAAARALDIDQATVGRRLAALEHALGATLFLRTSSGYELTPVGKIAIRAAEAMEQSAHDLVRHAQGVDKRLAGEVKLSTTDALAQEFVAPATGMESMLAKIWAEVLRSDRYWTGSGKRRVGHTRHRFLPSPA